MSDLTSFRDHCRKMAYWPHNGPGKDRELWLQMAAEIDAYLAQPAEAVDLFGDVTTEPTLEEA